MPDGIMIAVTVVLVIAGVIISHFVTVSTHHYDLMDVTIKASSNDKATAKSKFYYLKYCD